MLIQILSRYFSLGIATLLITTGSLAQATKPSPHTAIFATHIHPATLDGQVVSSRNDDDDKDDDKDEKDDNSKNKSPQKS